MSRFRTGPHHARVSHKYRAIIAVAVGGLLYLGARPSSLLMFGWAEALGLGGLVEVWRTVAGPFIAAAPDWVCFSLPFALWTYGFTVALRHSRWVGVAPSLAVGSELGQVVGPVPGTFDIVDLLLLVAAVGLALLPARPLARVASPLRPVAVTLAFTVLAAGSTEDPERKAARESEEAAALEVLTSYEDRLAQVHETLSQLDHDALREVSCGKAKLRETAGWEKGPLPLRTVHLPFLARFGKGKDAWGERDDYWNFINDSRFRATFRKHPEDRSERDATQAALELRDTFLPEHYLVVVAESGAHNAVEPKMKKKSFDGGIFVGWMFVIDQTNGELVCQRTLDVWNSDSIDYGGLLDSDDDEKEMHEDFEDNFEKALEAALPKDVKLETLFGSVLG